MAVTRIHKQASVRYSRGQMFALVNDIESYPEFLPWCTASRIIKKDQAALTASVSIAVGRIRQTYTTANTMRQDESIHMSLVKGPFKELNGCWRFRDNGRGGCCVSLDMQFQFKNRLIKHTLGKVFQRIIDSLVAAFIERARSLYGG